MSRAPLTINLDDDPSGLDDMDLSDFKPAPKKRAGERKKTSTVDKDVLDKSGFTSRQPNKPIQDPVRRKTVVRDEHLNIRMTAKAKSEFRALSEENGWTLGITFERAVSALKEKLSS